MLFARRTINIQHNNFVRQSETLAEEDENTKTRKQVLYIPTLGECEEYLRENVERGDAVILMGAGDVFRIGESLVSDE